MKVYSILFFFLSTVWNKQCNAFQWAVNNNLNRVKSSSSKSTVPSFTRSKHHSVGHQAVVAPASTAVSSSFASNPALATAIAIAGVLLLAFQEYRNNSTNIPQFATAHALPHDHSFGSNDTSYTVMESAAAAMSMPFTNDGMSNSTVADSREEISRGQQLEQVANRLPSFLSLNPDEETNDLHMEATTQDKTAEFTTLPPAISERMSRLVHQVGSTLEERQAMEELSTQRRQEALEKKFEKHRGEDKRSEISLNKSEETSPKAMLVTSAQVENDAEDEASSDTVKKIWWRKVWRVTKKVVSPWRKWENIRE